VNDPEAGPAGDPEAGLEALLAALAEPGPEPPPALVARTLHAARAELRAGSRRAFWRELIQLAAPAAAALPLVLAVDAAVVYAAWLALSRWLPVWAADLAVALPALYAFGALGWLALFWGALPVLAHQRLARRALAAEVSP
jgi:hypothetical protein